MNRYQNAIIPDVIREHVEEAGSIFETRSRLAAAANISIEDLSRFDQRLAAHLDGLLIAGDCARTLCFEPFMAPSSGAVFTAAVLSIDAGDQTQLDRLFALVGAEPATRDGLNSAFGWMEPARLQGVVSGLLGSCDALHRLIGITACAMHGVGPAPEPNRWFEDASAEVRARVLRSAGELGRVDVLPMCAAALADEDPECRFWAAWSGVLLGNRGLAVTSLTQAATRGPHRRRAFQLLLQATDVVSAHSFLQDCSRETNQLRRLIEGSGINGDPTYVPWLIKHMTDDHLARIAGEAFCLITGCVFDDSGLERPRPENFESGPNDDPNDPNIAMDPDDGLPWPDADKIKAWWAKNSSRFQPGTRYFMGAPVTRQHCIEVLRNGYQRQRILASHYLCLLNPGTPLFNTSAPAWRQQRLLAELK
jgi:uncharacterized protein (TIGR02270 family)